MLALGSASNIGATIGTTTTAISIKSKKKPKIKMTNITTKNCTQKPPGKLVSICLTSSSPPKARNAEVSIAAPISIINTIEVVLAVSPITSCKVVPVLKTRQPLQVMANNKVAEAIKLRAIPRRSSSVLMLLILRSKLLTIMPKIMMEAIAINAGQ